MSAPGKIVAPAAEEHRKTAGVYRQTVAEELLQQREETLARGAELGRRRWAPRRDNCPCNRSTDI